MGPVEAGRCTLRTVDEPLNGRAEMYAARLLLTCLVGGAASMWLSSVEVRKDVLASGCLDERATEAAARPTSFEEDAMMIAARRYVSPQCCDVDKMKV